MLQVLWSSKVKFVSLSQLLGCPLFGSNPWFSQLQVYCLTCGDLKKKKKQGRKKRYKGRERRSRTRMKEREEQCVKRKKK